MSSTIPSKILKSNNMALSGIGSRAGGCEVVAGFFLGKKVVQLPVKNLGFRTDLGRLSTLKLRYFHPQTPVVSTLKLR
jgi:hypothetical protein